MGSQSCGLARLDTLQQKRSPRRCPVSVGISRPWPCRSLGLGT
ncbi:MAG: hypothetical protein O3C67_05255 [Cyanobacteria bacterium]|nr:hypothetical protein [Cyanobacteriota bacterium]